MKTIKSIYKIGFGPSSSHTMGPKRAAELFKDKLSPSITKIIVELYGSLAATGKGHLTDKAIRDELAPYEVEFIWNIDENLSKHPNTMVFKAFLNKDIIKSWRVCSVGGGDLLDDKGPVQTKDREIYEEKFLADVIHSCRKKDITLLDYIDQKEPKDIWDHLKKVWQVMKQVVAKGISTEPESLPGPLKLKRKAYKMLESANNRIGVCRDLNLISAYALAVAEENASGNQIVTAPTCGSAGVMPGVLYYFYKHHQIPEVQIINALAVGGLFGVYTAGNASISGAEVGCQGEIGTASSMAAAAATYLLNGTSEQIEYSAEMGLEHFLGLTCDPVKGLVQIPCIERNAFAAMRAFDCAAYACSTDGSHLISFDEVVSVMYKTGQDLQRQYRETALGGLAKIMSKKVP